MLKNTIKLSLFTLFISSFSTQAVECGEVGADGASCEADERITVTGRDPGPVYTPIPKMIPRGTSPSTGEPSSTGRESKDEEKEKERCETQIERDYQHCRLYPLSKYRDTLKDDCRWKVSATVGADGVFVRTSATSDEYAKCAELAAATRDLDLGICKLDKAQDLLDKCNK